MNSKHTAPMPRYLRQGTNRAHVLGLAEECLKRAPFDSFAVDHGDETIGYLTRKANLVRDETQRDRPWSTTE